MIEFDYVLSMRASHIICKLLILIILISYFIVMCKYINKNVIKYLETKF